MQSTLSFPHSLLSIIGEPFFITQPPSKIYVNENASLQLKIEIGGYPKPSADFIWTHLSNTSSTNISSAELYPFVYSSTYSVDRIDGSYCGRILQTTLKNSIGSSSVRETNVTVYCKITYAFLHNIKITNLFRHLSLCLALIIC